MDSLESLSLLLIWTAIGIYAAAFVAFAFDLARRSQESIDARVPAKVEANAYAMAGGGARGSGLPDTTVPDAPASDSPASGAPRRRRVMARIGTSLTVLGFVFHLAGTLGRGIAAGRVPWANLYEFAMIGTLLIIAVYLAMLIRIELRYLGAFIVGLVVVLLGAATINFYVDITPLMDPLKSAWLVIHTFVASLSTAFFALAFALSVLQLMQTRRERRVAEGAKRAGPKYLRTLPDAAGLEGLAYRFTVIGFVFWTFTLIAGAIWAQDSWGRYWGFDVKETWTFIIWVLYAGYIHARATRGWRGTRSAWLSIIGFCSVLFNFTIVNVFFKGLHAYSGLS